MTIFDEVPELHNAKTKVLFYIINQIKENGILVGTYKSIGEESETSLSTAQKVINILLEEGVLNRLGQHAYEPSKSFEKVPEGEQRYIMVEKA
jgi:hypothetical protein